MKYVLYTTFFLLSFATMCSAATVDVRAPSETVVGNTVQMQVLVDPSGVPINSLDITLSFPTSLYSFKGYDAEGGVVTVWVARPKEIAPGVIHFAGVIPGGIDRSYDPLHPTDRAFPAVTLLFTALAPGSGEVAVTDSLLLQNDGRGTPLPATIGDARVVVRDRIGTAPSAVTDTTAPLPFTLEIIEGSQFGKTPRLVIFETSDDSGIKGYEARINSKKFAAVESPYVVPNRLWPYTLTVRAVDFSGNTTDAAIVVHGRGAGYLGLVAVLILIAIVWYRYRRRQRTTVS